MLKGIVKEKKKFIVITLAHFQNKNYLAKMSDLRTTIGFEMFSSTP
jgi:hypothetical protein